MEGRECGMGRGMIHETMGRPRRIVFMRRCSFGFNTCTTMTVPDTLGVWRMHVHTEQPTVAFKSEPRESLGMSGSKVIQCRMGWRHAGDGRRVNVGS